MKIGMLGNHAISYSSETHHAKSLESLGHEVVRFQESRVPASTLLAETQDIDLFIWIHTHGWDTPGIEEVLTSLRERRIPIITYSNTLAITLAFSDAFICIHAEIIDISYAISKHV